MVSRLVCLSKYYTTITIQRDYNVTPGLLVSFFKSQINSTASSWNKELFLFHPRCTVYACQPSSLDLALLIFPTARHNTGSGFMQ